MSLRVLFSAYYYVYFTQQVDNIAHHIKLYADDSKIIYIIKTLADTASLQDNMDISSSGYPLDYGLFHRMGGNLIS